MLKYKVGCLIEAATTGEVNVIAHQCNCFNTMGSGIAPLIAKAFPLAEKADNQTEKGSIGKLGGFSYAYDPTYDVNVYNLYGQYGYSRTGQDTDYYALRKALVRMREDLMVPVGYKIGFPKLGAGLGGGNWGTISSLIEDIFNGYDVTIYVLNDKEIPND